jgi:hypothetical protein
VRSKTVRADQKILQEAIKPVWTPLYCATNIIIISIGAFIPIINAIYPSNNIANALPPSSVLGAVIE